MKRNKQIPHFKTEDEEREFWASHDIIDYVDMKSMIINPQLPNLKPTTKSINIRLPTYLLNAIKQTAGSYDLPYQSLMKLLLKKGLTQFQQEHHYKSA